MGAERVEKKSPSLGVVIARKAIWLVIMAICMVTLVLWIVMPTRRYRNFYTNHLMKVIGSSTFFGRQGATLLMFTFPILLVASLSCVYLHLGDKIHQNIKFGSNGKKKKDARAFLKQPMLVKGPLGIVSSTELAFFLMFVALMVWSLGICLQNVDRFAKDRANGRFHRGMADPSEKMWQFKLEIAGFYLGVVGNIGLALLFFPVSRGSSILPFFGLTSEASIKYHIWVGHIVMTLLTAHGLFYIVAWVAAERYSEMIEWDKTRISNLAGEISLLAGLGLWLTTSPRIRRKMFELFFYTHYLYIFFMLFFILHVRIFYSYIMLPGFYLFLIDRYLRFLQSRQKIAVVSARILPADTLELNFSKNPGLKYNPTSIMFLNIPSISKLQWHPFTISSSSNLDQDNLSIIIKNEGSWSHKLYQMLSSSPSNQHLEAAVEGPYGPVSTNFLRHDTLVMVSGGSGITPFISIIQEFMFMSKTLNCKTPQIILICAFKNSNDVTMLDLILPISETPFDFSNIQLQIKAYVTREQQPNPESKKQIRNLLLNPKSTDVPFSAILGPNSWLWLSVIISVSFVVFLILIGIITRYYIYPIDHNQEEYFSASAQAVINLLVMCSCIGLVSSIAVLWNKQRNAKEAMKILNMERSNQAKSLISWPSDVDKELESLPLLSLAQVTDVHFGGRPDLKTLLLECKGSNTGVLVCGPKKMRHDVASICSSGLANNLHFESISFNW